MNIESVGTPVVSIGVVIHHQHEVVGAVVLEGRGEIERVPSLLAIQMAGIYLLKAGYGNVIRSAGKFGFVGVSQIDRHIRFIR